MSREPVHDGQPGADPTKSVYYLLKHAQLRLRDLTAAALVPHGITGRELAALMVVAGTGVASQQHAAQRLDVDRTTMVALLDTLEEKGLIVRHPDTADRRRNVVELTASGRNTLRRASQASDEAEREFLAPLSQRAVQQLKAALRALTET